MNDIERILRERALASKSRVFSISLSKLLKTANVHPASAHLLVEHLLNVSSDFELAYAYIRARGCKKLRRLLREKGIVVIAHHKSILFFRKISDGSGKSMRADSAADIRAKALLE